MIKLVSQYVFVIFLAAFSAVSMAKGKDNLGVGIAEWGILDGYRVVTVNLDFEASPMRELYGLAPVVSLMWRKENEFYFALGAAKYFYQYKKLYIGVGFSAGYLNRPDELGYKLEFYSRMIGRYQLTPTQWLKIEVGHISNAGFGDKNPGSENIALSYMFSF